MADYIRGRLSERPTSEREYSLWLTPRATEPNEPPGNVARRLGDRTENADGSITAQANKWANWPSPTQSDGDSAGSRNLPGSKAHPGTSLTDATKEWSTPTRAQPGGNVERFVERKRIHNRKGGSNIGEAVTDLQMQATLWATPTEQDSSNNAGPSQWDRNSDPLNVEAQKFEHGQTPSPAAEPTEPSVSSPRRQLKRGLNPRFGLWLMGFPDAWLD